MSEQMETEEEMAAIYPDEDSWAGRYFKLRNEHVLIRQQLAEVTEQRDGLAEALHAVYGMCGSDNPMPEAFLDASLIAKAALAQRRKEEGK
jgi:hypothetical protein